MSQLPDTNTSFTFKDEDVELVEFVGEQAKSRTQSIKILIIRKAGKKLVSLQKWWRKSAEAPWEEGKGFHFTKAEVDDAIKKLEEARDLLED
ncbi:hypothetical protein D3C74_51140 [compost metagenome]